MRDAQLFRAIIYYAPAPSTLFFLFFFFYFIFFFRCFALIYFFPFGLEKKKYTTYFNRVHFGPRTRSKNVKHTRAEAQRKWRKIKEILQWRNNYTLRFDTNSNLTGQIRAHLRIVYSRVILKRNPNPSLRPLSDSRLMGRKKKTTTNREEKKEKSKRTMPKRCR